MWLLAAKNVKEIWRDKKILTVSLFFPAFLLLITHLFFTRSETLFGDIPLDVVNSDKTIGKFLVLALQKTKFPHSEKGLFGVSNVSKEEALADLQMGKTAAALVIPSRLGRSINQNQSGKILLLVNPNDKRAAVLIPALSSWVEHFDFLIEKSRGKGTVEPITLTYAAAAGGAVSPELESFLNIFVFALIFLISYAGGSWISEFERGSFTRFQLSRFPEKAMLGGMFLSALGLGLVQVLFLLAVGKAFGLPVDPLIVEIWPYAVLLILASTGAGFIFATLLEKEKQMNLYASLFLIPLYLLSSSVADDLQLDRFSGYLPWHQGLVLLTESIRHEPLQGFLMIRMIFSSLILAFFGLGIFSLKRLRHGS